MDNEHKVKQLFALIEQHRLFKGLNKRQLAEAAEITPQYYSELLEGRKMPSIVIVFRLLDVVGCDLVPVFKPVSASERG